MKHHRARQHNYVKKLNRLIAQRALPVDTGLYQLDIHHDAWCGLNRGKRCNCDPDVRLKTYWTPRPQG